jgi:soluble lytic murein transglycosylase
LNTLLRLYSSPEYALAAYNAGGSRVAAWTAQSNFADPAEFVESIPFTETQGYVQAVIRNQRVYRALYGSRRETPRRALRGR